VTQKEIYDDAVFTSNILESNESEKITNIENQIAKQHNIIALIQSKSEVTKTDKSLALERLKSQLATMRKSRDLLIANEDKTITSIQNDISVARADLNKEYIASGDYKIVSPFS